MTPIKLALSALALALASLPALAQETHTCTEAELVRVQAEADKLTDPAKKHTVTNEVLDARQALNDKELQRCFTHLNNAIQMLPKS